MAQNDRSRHTVWMDDGTWKQMHDIYKQNNCTTQSEFIEKAVRFYMGYLSAEGASNYLPGVLSPMLEGMFNAFADRTGKLLFKQAVEASMMMHIIAADTDIDEETLNRLRGRCVRDVQRTNGQIGFRDILRFQKSI